MNRKAPPASADPASADKASRDGHTLHDRLTPREARLLAAPPARPQKRKRLARR